MPKNISRNLFRPNPKGLRIPLEEHDYDWILEANSPNFVPHPDFLEEFGTRKLSDIPPARLQDVKEITQNGLDRPEIVDAYRKWVNGSDVEYDVANVVVKWFLCYLEMKYGVRTRAVGIAHNLIRNFALNDWYGYDDPKCKRFIATSVKYQEIIK